MEGLHSEIEWTESKYVHGIVMCSGEQTVGNTRELDS